MVIMVMNRIMDYGSVVLIDHSIVLTPFCAVIGGLRLALISWELESAVLRFNPKMRISKR